VIFTSQGYAKRFFVERIVAQAEAEGQPLSVNEQWMLSFSESDPEFAVDPDRVESLAAEIPDEEYEAKVTGLIQRACERDAASDPSAVESYRHAYEILSQGDHYLVIMLEQGLERWLRPWWAFWRPRR
jgi:hypothetical protein